MVVNKKNYAEKTEELALLKSAWEKAINAQSYAIGDRELSRASVRELRREIDELEEAIDAYESGRGKRRAKRAVPI